MWYCLLNNRLNFVFYRKIRGLNLSIYCIGKEIYDTGWHLPYLYPMLFAAGRDGVHY
jgi:hypothetical protein